MSDDRKDSFRWALLELMKQNLLIQGLIVLTLVGIVGYLYVNQIEVPIELVNVISIIIGFYFGGKAQQKIS